MNVWKRKLNSEQGASIAMALLIFLICAVVGSAVLVAGTTASGRMSKTAEYDQRYYAVNSAVRLLRDTIEDKTIKVVNQKGSTNYEMYLVETGEDGETETEITDYRESFPAEAAYRILIQNTSLSSPRQMTLTASDSALGDSVNVTVDETIKSDGSMVFLVTKETDSKPYAVEITFAMDKEKQSVISGTANGSQSETITSTLQWKLSDIRTVENKAGIVNDDG